MPWHWHIVEGLAALRHDTAWSVGRGGRVPNEFELSPLSNDGTTGYLDELRGTFPENVTVYRKKGGQIWDGKIEMVSAPISQIRESALLWQVDADELWTVQQIEAVHELFRKQPDRTAAIFPCQFFVGPDLCTDRWQVYGNFVPGEWLRVWRFEPGDRWASHEPPRLVRSLGEKNVEDVAAKRPFSHTEMAAAGLVFQHFAYATEQQVRFKESYYGYPGAVKAWRKLQQSPQDQIRLRNVLPWIWEAEIGKARTFRTFFRWIASPFSRASIGENPRAKGIMPLAQRNVLGDWRFFSESPPNDSILTIVIIRADRIGDHILSSVLLKPLRKAYPFAKIVIACPEDVRQLHEQRPEIDELITFDRARGHRSASYRRGIIRRLRLLHVDLAITPQASRDKLSTRLMLHCGAKRKAGFQAEPRGIKLREWQELENALDIKVPRAEERETELERYERLLAAIGCTERPLPPEIALSAEDKSFAVQMLAASEFKDRQVVALFTGSAQSEKVFRGLGNILGKVLDPNAIVLVLGAQEDFEAGEAELRAWKGKGLNLCGRTTLGQAAALLAHCRFVIGPDSGLSHLACAVGCQHVVIMGGGDFGRFFPYSSRTAIVCLPLDCYDCQWRCRFPEPYCLRQISSQVVEEAMRQTLARESSKPRVFMQTGFRASVPDGSIPKWKSHPLLASRDWEVIPVNVEESILRSGS